MTIHELPKRRHETLDARISLAVPKRMRSQLFQLKDKGIEHLEWVRMILDRELEKIETENQQ